LLGTTFRRAGWKQDYPGVVEQYREERATESMHLKVFADGTWTVDHVDDYNPDLQLPLQHFFADYLMPVRESPLSHALTNVEPFGEPEGA
jgi:hypothetical protein